MHHPSPDLGVFHVRPVAPFPLWSSVSTTSYNKKIFECHYFNHFQYSTNRLKMCFWGVFSHYHYSVTIEDILPLYTSLDPPLYNINENLKNNTENVNLNYKYFILLQVCTSQNKAVHEIKFIITWRISGSIHGSHKVPWLCTKKMFQ